MATVALEVVCCRTDRNPLGGIPHPPIRLHYMVLHGPYTAIRHARRRLDGSNELVHALHRREAGLANHVWYRWSGV